MKTRAIINTTQSGKKPVSTDLTIDWTGMTEDDMRAMAQQSLIIKVRITWKKNGVPAVDNIKAVDHRVGTRAVAGPVDIMAEVSKMTPEERLAMIERVKAMK